VNPPGDSRDGPGATLREKTLGEFVRNSRKGGARHFVEGGPGHSGRGEQRPYGIFLRQCACEIIRRENQKSRPFGNALRMNPSGIRETSAAGPFGLGGAAAGTACCAPTGYCYGKTRPGVESGSKLPHSRETGRRLVWGSAVEQIKRGGPSQRTLGESLRGFTRQRRRYPSRKDSG
jgi:hypothetical protein